MFSQTWNLNISNSLVGTKLVASILKKKQPQKNKNLFQVIHVHDRKRIEKTDKKKEKNTHTCNPTILRS